MKIILDQSAHSQTVKGFVIDRVFKVQKKKKKKQCNLVLANLPANCMNSKCIQIALSYLMKIFNFWNTDYPSICGRFCVMQTLNQHWMSLLSVP